MRNMGKGWWFESRTGLSIKRNFRSSEVGTRLDTQVNPNKRALLSFSFPMIFFLVPLPKSKAEIAPKFFLASQSPTVSPSLPWPSPSSVYHGEFSISHSFVLIRLAITLLLHHHWESSTDSWFLFRIELLIWNSSPIYTYRYLFESRKVCYRLIEDNCNVGLCSYANTFTHPCSVDRACSTSR